MSAAEEALAAALDDLGLEYEREHRFDKVRRWRADFCVYAGGEFVLVEVEGRGWYRQSRDGWRPADVPAGQVRVTVAAAPAA